MSALTSLLVRDRVVSVSKIEEALHSQVFNGGDIEVILLEMGVIAEDVLSAYRAALFDLLPATREEVMKARDALRRVPAELARSLGIVPIYFEGRSLVVAAWEPLHAARLREVESQLGWEVSVRIVNQARLASALAHHYGFELEPRMRRLSDALRRRDPGVVPYVRPPGDSMRPIARGVADDDSDEDSDGEITGVSLPPLPPPPSFDRAPEGALMPMPVPEALMGEAEEREPVQLPGQHDERIESDAAAQAEVELARGEPVAELLSPETLSAEPAHTDAEVEPARVHNSPSEVSGLVAVELPTEQGDDDAGERDDVPHGVSSELAAQVRGPIALERAVELLQSASQRDDVLFLLLRYVQQYFDFACVFGVAKDGVRARMAHGSGLLRHLVEHVFVPNPSAGLMADVLRTKRPQLGHFGDAPDEHAAATLLRREPSRLALAVPLDINQRVVLIVFADRIGAGLTLEHADIVQAVAPAVCMALRRIILEAKTQRLSGAPSAPPLVEPLATRASSSSFSEARIDSALARESARDALMERAEAHLREPARARAPEGAQGAEPESVEPLNAEAALTRTAANDGPLELSPEPAPNWQAEVLDSVGAEFEPDPDREVDQLLLDGANVAPGARFDSPLARPGARFDRASNQELDAELDQARAQYDAETEAALADFEAAASQDSSTSAFESELSAVDLDAFERLIREDATSDLHVIAKGQPAARDANDTASIRERIAGVPRSAPPPPPYEPAQPPPIANGYRFRGSAGLAQERLRVEIASAASLPLPESDVQPSGESKSPQAAAERHKLALVEPAVNEPSVIIDMGESVDALVAALLGAPPNSEPVQIDELVQIGESALPVLMQHFPGPLWFDRKRPHRRRARGRDVSAVARAVTAFGERAAPYLASLLAGGDPERSYYALLVAGEIVHADLLDPVARRVLDRDESLRALALEILRSYAVLPQYDVVVRAISDLTERPGKDPRRQRLAVEALGALRDPRALRTLLVRLSDRDEQIVQAAHDALVVLTGQDFGFSSRKWESWVEGWGRAHRVEWLIESLLHSDESVRSTAGEELKQLTQQYFGYHPSLPKRERELAQRKYREWWELEGRLTFGR